MALPKQEHIAIAERLQTKVLEVFEKRLLDGSLSDTGVATLVRLLAANGWSLDPALVPKGLRGVIQELKDDPRLIQEDDVDLSRQH